MEKVLTLKTPLMVDGEELKELPYDFEAMTAGSLLRIAGDMAATGHSRTTVQEYDSDYHFFLFAQAVELATKGKVSTPDVLRLSAKLVAELADLKEQLQLQHTNAQDFRDEILSVVAKYETK